MYHTKLIAFMPKEISVLINWTKLIRIYMVVIYIFIQILKYVLQANSANPDQKPRFAASDLVLHCLPMSRKMDARLLRVD